MYAISTNLGTFFDYVFLRVFFGIQPLQKPSGPSWCLSIPVRFFFQKTFSSIWAIWVWSKSCWNPFEKQFGPNWKFGSSVPCQQQILSKAIWTNLDFKQSCSYFVQRFIMVYQGTMDFYKIVLGFLKKIIWTKKNLRHLYQSKGQGFQRLNGPSGFLSNPVRFLFKNLLWYIWARWISIDFYWASLGK